MIKHIKVGAVDYTVHLLPKKIENQYGACVYEHQKIYLSPRQTHQQVSDTLLHEVLHAIWNEAGLEYSQELEQETIVRTLSTWLRIVFTDNPELVKFILNSKTKWPHGPTSDPVKEATE